jgi:hypothetical protein
MGLVWAVTATGLTGALLMGGSGIWGDRVMLRLGLWVTVVNIAGALAGPGWQALILAVAGGGVQVVIGARSALARRPGRRAVAAGAGTAA